MLSTHPLTHDVGSLTKLNEWLRSQRRSLGSNREIPEHWLHPLTAHQHHDRTPLGCILMHTPWLQKRDPVTKELTLVSGTPFLAQRLVGICAPICSELDPEKTFVSGPIRQGTLIFMTDEISDAGSLAV